MGLSVLFSVNSVRALGLQAKNIHSVHVWSNTSDSTHPKKKRTTKKTQAFYILMCKTNRLLFAFLPIFSLFFNKLDK